MIRLAPLPYWRRCAIIRECLAVERARRLSVQASSWRGYVMRMELLLEGVL